METLFHKFHASVSSRIGSKTKSIVKSKHTPRRGTGGHHGSAGTDLTGSSPRCDEELQCPICLLEMVDGESLTICDGCSNTLHQHCMAICKSVVLTYQLTYIIGTKKIQLWYKK